MMHPFAETAHTTNGVRKTYMPADVNFVSGELISTESEIEQVNFQHCYHINEKGLS
jgi:hypothetical protein